MLAPEEFTVSNVVVGMHFVCKGDLNVTDHGDGTPFGDTGFWKVARKHCDDVEYVALHETRAGRSYRQGRVLSWRTTTYEGGTRVIFTVEDDGEGRSWVGGANGEKGYPYGQHRHWLSAVVMIAAT